MNTWLVFISIHTVVAVVCFIAGFFIISPDRAKKYRWLMAIFFWSLFLMVIFMIAATLSHWLSLSSSQKIIFTGLAGLGIYMGYRGFKAKRCFSLNQFNDNYFDDVGFVLIGLFDGFAIVSLLDAKMPVWIIVSGGILVIFIGRYFVRKIKHQFSNGK